MISGSCLCSGIRYEYDGQIDELVICHCDQCKRAQGTPFATNAPILKSRFTIICGHTLLKQYRSSPDKIRVFCSVCGSPIYSQHKDKPQLLRLRAGTITSEFDHVPDYQQYCRSAASWFELNSNISTYQAGKE